MSSIMKGLVDEQDIEETKKLSAQEKFKRSMARAGYDMDAGAKRLQDLLDKQKKEREELEKKEQKDVSEDATLQFAAEITPTVNPHAGIKDRKFRGAIGEGIKRMFEEPNYSPTDAGYQEGGWRKMNEEEVSEDLRKWFKEKWVRFGPDGKIRGACARGSSSEGKPKCLPQAKAHALGKKGRKYAAAKKRREDPNPERSGPAKNVATKKKSKSESINEGLWDWIKDKLSNKKPIQWSETYYDFIIRNDPLYLQAYLNAVKNDPNYIEWKKNNPNAAQQSTPQTNYTGSQNRPEQYQSGDDFTAPHGSSENELKMFVNGTKPAAIVPEPNFSTWAKIINSGKYWTKQLISNGKLHSIIIVQPGNEESGKQIYELVQNAMNLANQGDFRAYENSNYHRRLGKLLGYPKDKIEQWINNYFKDKVDLAKTKIDEQDLNETLDQPYKLKWYPGDMDEQDVAEDSAGNWYVRVKGKVLKDKQFNAIPFSSEEAARTKAMEIYRKKRIPLEMIKLTQSWMDGPEQGVAEGLESQYLAARYIDEFGDGDHWYVKGTPDVIKKFVLLANSLEDEAVKGSEYEPGKGMMAKMHSALGNDSVPQWTVVQAKNLEGIKPIGDKVVQQLMRPNLNDGAQEFMSKLLWAMEEEGLALVKGVEKLDELKCWPGYTRVKSVPAGAPGSCKKKTNEDYQQGPECGGAMYEVSLMNEKKDACYYKVKSRYKVWPSAYASGALVKCRKKGASNWGNKSKSNEGQIYSTGGGAGQSYRYYTPKDNLGESNIMAGILGQKNEK